jgi:hypothetical protein
MPCQPACTLKIAGYERNGKVVVVAAKANERPP